MLFITHQRKLATSNVKFSSHLSEDVESLFESGVKPSKICLCTDKQHAYSDVKIAVSKKVNYQIDGVQYVTPRDALERALLFCSIAETAEQKNEAFERIKTRVLNTYPLKISKQTLEQRINCWFSCPLESKKLFDELMGVIQTQEEIVKTYHQYISHPAISVDTRPLSQVDDLDTAGFITILATSTGTSKTQLMKSYFNREAAQSRYAMWMNGSRALTNAFSNQNQKQHYDIQFNHSDTSCVYGVALKLLLKSQYAEQRNRTQALFIDEVEHVFDLLTSDLVGSGSMEDRETAIINMKQLFKQSDFVVVADAFPSKHTIESLVEWAEASNKKLRIFADGNVTTKPIVSVYEYEHHHKDVKARLANNERIFAFCDASHAVKPSRFDTEYNQLTEHLKESVCLKVDADFSKSESSYLLKHPDELAEKYQLIYANAAIMNGLSITHQGFTHASLFLNGTNLANDVCQAKHRIRNVETVGLSFSKSHHFNDVVTDPIHILYLILVNAIKGPGFDERLHRAIRSPELNWIAERIAFKNESRKHYSFTLLTMLRQQGHLIEFKNLDLPKSGANKLKVAHSDETYKFIADVVNADMISDVEADRMSRKGSLSRVDNAKLTSYRIRRDFGVQNVSYELVEKYVVCKLYKIINNYRQAFGNVDSSTVKNQLHGAILKRTLDIALENGGYCSNATTRTVLDFRDRGTIDVQGVAMKVKLHFDAIFPLNKFNPSHIRTVETLLGYHFGITLDKTDTKRTRKPKDITWRKAKLDETLVKALKHLGFFDEVSELLSRDFEIAS